MWLSLILKKKKKKKKEKRKKKEEVYVALTVCKKRSFFKKQLASRNSSITVCIVFVVPQIRTKIRFFCNSRYHWFSKTGSIISVSGFSGWIDGKPAFFLNFGFIEQPNRIGAGFRLNHNFKKKKKIIIKFKGFSPDPTRSSHFLFFLPSFSQLSRTNWGLNYNTQIDSDSDPNFNTSAISFCYQRQPQRYSFVP